MITLTELLGGNDAAWMSDPRRPCALPKDMPAKDIQIAADQWYPTNGERDAWATKMCAGCPSATKNSCLQYALDNRIAEGIWGGLSETDRADILRGNKPAPPPTIIRDTCGTLAGQSAHRRRKEPACPDCLDAWNNYRRDWRARRRNAA